MIEMVDALVGVDEWLALFCDMDGMNRAYYYLRWITVR